MVYLQYSFLQCTFVEKAKKSVFIEGSESTMYFEQFISFKVTF